MSNFFEQQHTAQRKTRVMVFLYGLAVLGVVAAVNTAIAGAWLVTNNRVGFRAPAGLGSVPGSVYLAATLVTLCLISAASLIEALRLRQAGEAVAAMVGARRIASDTTDALERRLLNVVEEMAIASGVRLPLVFVMDRESGINAFAAGHDPSHAVIAVTRGTLESLTRDELQGVIGHEFSHILNGDMSLNIRLLGTLAGIVFIGSIGAFIMRNLGGSRNSGPALFVLGLALFVIGYVGLFFARLIKAAVSRQREYLADASSVQFTRNPDGIAGALDQIRAGAHGSLIGSRYAEEVSHMFFSQGIGVWLGGLFDTHPPLDERIRRVNPGFSADGYRRRRSVSDRPANEEAATTAGAAAGQGAPAQGLALIGAVHAHQLDQAQWLLARLPADLRPLLRSPEEACAIVIAVAMADDDGALADRLAAARAAGQSAMVEGARLLMPTVRGLGPAFRLPMVDLALPTLKAAAASLQQDLIKALAAVIHADGRVSLHEFAVLALIRSQLRPAGRPATVKPTTIAERRDETLLVLELAARAGCGSDEQAQQRFRSALLAAAKEVGLEADATEAATAMMPADLDSALDRLRTLAPLQKALLIKALFAAVMADGVVHVAEAELLRAVAAALECPLGPMSAQLDPQRLAA